jgi:hypothetical protein
MSGPPPPEAPQAPTGEDAICDICNDGGREDMMLLCDLCDCGWHRDCMKPAVTQIPEGDWFCAGCRAKGIPEGYSFGKGDKVCCIFNDDCKWIGRIREIEGNKALIHFDGWKPIYDQSLNRSMLVPLPPPEVLSRASHGRLPTKAENEKYEKKLAEAKALEETKAREQQLAAVREKIKGISNEDEAARASAKAEERAIRRLLPPKHKDHLKPERPVSLLSILLDHLHHGRRDMYIRHCIHADVCVSMHATAIHRRRADDA